MLTAQRVMMKATELALTGEKVTMQNIVVNDTNRDEFRDRLVRYFTDIIPLPPEVGIEERIPEVGMVCVENGRIIGVATIAKVLIRQLGMDMWFYRTSVSPDHRHVDIARSLANDLYAHMDAQYEPGKGMPCGVLLPDRSRSADPEPAALCMADDWSRLYWPGQYGPAAKYQIFHPGDAG